MKKNYASIKQLSYKPSCGGIERTDQKQILWTGKLLSNPAQRYCATGSEQPGKKSGQ